MEWHIRLHLGSEDRSHLINRSIGAGVAGPRDKPVVPLEIDMQDTNS